MRGVGFGLTFCETETAVARAYFLAVRCFIRWKQWFGIHVFYQVA
jgi:hypothetical protein